MGINGLMFLTVILGGVMFWGIAVRRFHDGMEMTTAGLGWIGSLLVLISFLALVWIKPSDPQAFEKNLKWMQKRQKEIEDVLEKIPEINTTLGMDEMSIYQLLDSGETHDFLKYAKTGKSMYAWHLLKLSWSIAPELSIVMVLGLLSGLIGTLIAISEMLAGRRMWRALAICNAVMAGISFAFIISKVAFLDTLGTFENARIRLIAALAEMEISSASWWMLMGLFLVVLSGVMHYFLHDIIEDDDLDTYEERYSYHE